MNWTAADPAKQPDTEGWDASAVSCGRGARDGSALDGPTEWFLALCDSRFHSSCDTVHTGGTDYCALRSQAERT